MAISDRINEMYTHVGDVYDTITNVDLPTNKNIQNIPSTMRSSYLEIMNNGIDTIWNNWEKVEGTGESLSLNSTEEAPMKINLKGNTSQETTTGKNLIGLLFVTPPTKVAGANFDYSLNSFTLQGTTTSTWAIINLNYNYKIQTGKTYTMSANVTGTNPKMQISAIGYDTGRNELFRFRINQSNNYTQTITTNFSEQIDLCTFVIEGLENGGTYNLSATDIQIEESATKTSFEPYTNGASPNPDYPQDIHVVSGDNTIKVEGKNLYYTDQNEYEYTTSTSGWKFINGVGGANGAYVTNTLYKAPIKNGETYTFTAKVNASSSVVSTLVDNNENQIARNDGATANFNTTFTARRDGYVILRNYVNANVSVTISEVQLEKGTQATEYEAYKSASYPISLGNIELCKIGDYQDSIKKSTGKNLIQSGYRQGNTTSTTATNRLFTSHSAYVKANQTYTISTNLNTSNFYWAIRVASSDFPTNADITTGDWNTTSSLTYTPTQNGYLAVIIGKRDLNANISESDIGNTYFQVEEGSTATSYEPYGKGEWYLQQSIGEVVFTNATNWYYDTSNTRFSTQVTGSRTEGSRFPIISNYFLYASSGGGNGVGFNYGGSIWLYNYDCTSVSEFQAWLGEHNTDVYYVLATPNYTKITYEPLLEQLEAFYNAKSKNSQTNISQENNDKPFILDVTALKQLTQ